MDAGYLRSQHERSEERKRLQIVARGPLQSPGYSRQRWNLFVPRTGGPPITALQTLRVRRCDDVNEPKNYAPRQHHQFDVQLLSPRDGCRLTLELSDALPTYPKNLDDRNDYDEPND